MARKQAIPIAERRIYFYRVDPGLENGQPRPQPNLTAMLRALDSLTHSVGGRYYSTDEGVLTSWVDSAVAHRMRFGHSRRSALPQVELGGRLSSLRIAQNAGLAEAVHVTFFQGGIVGTDFNFYGPRVSGLGRYLAAVVPNADRFELHPLIRGEAATALQGLRNATYLQIRVHPDYVDAVSGANESRGAAFRAQRDLGDAKSYELVWRRRGRRGRDGLLASLLRLAQRNDLREGALKFVVKGVLEETDRIATVDLLRDQLISTKRIFRQSVRSRALRPESAYEAIREAHTELRDQLRDAMMVTR